MAETPDTHARWQLGGDLPAWLQPWAFAAMGGPIHLLQAVRIEEVLPVVREAWRASVNGAWCCGFIAYEAASAFDASLRTRQSHAWSVQPSDGAFSQAADKPTDKPTDKPSEALPLACFLVSSRPPLVQPTARLASSGDSAFTFTQPWVFDNAIARDHAVASIESARNAIADGRYYQLNLTAGLSAQGHGNVFDLFERMGALQPAMLGVCMETPLWSVASASPELFFQWDGDLIQTRPMKGTAAPSGNPHIDRDRLRASEKDRAENVMIVDLLRNDLSRIAKPGSVTVPSLFDVHTHPTVVQMTSTVQAHTRDGTTLEDVLKALFPCGSVTGAPKHEAMGHLADLEQHGRGVYCGAVGVLAPGGKAFFNVAIRTVVHHKRSGRLRYGVGSGLTWYSDAAAEWKEWQWKTRIAHRAARAFRILETARLQDGVWQRQEAHLARMGKSANAFGYVFDAQHARIVLQHKTAEQAVGAWRGRWLLDADGDLQIELHPLDTVALPLTLQLAANAMDLHAGELPFVQNKTTWRLPYERHASRLTGSPDVLLKTTDGQLLETARGNLVMDDGNGLWTPDSAWQLPGVLQQDLLASGVVKAARITLENLKNARAVWIVNSLRGWMPVQRIVDAQGGLLMRFEPDFRVSSVP